MRRKSRAKPTRKRTKPKARAERPARTSTTSRIAEIFGVDPQTIQSWAKRGCPHRKQANGLPLLFNEGEVAAWKVANQVSGRPGRPPDRSAGGSAIKSARVRKELALAAKYELQVLKEAGRLLSAEEVETQWQNIGRVVGNALATLGTSIVPLALKHGMPQAEVASFQEEVDGLGRQIAEHLSRFGEAEDDEAGQVEVLPGDEAAGDLDDEPVGGAGAADPGQG